MSDADAPGPGYERPVTALRGGSRRFVIAAILGVVVIVVAIAKPWAAADDGGRVASLASPVATRDARASTAADGASGAAGRSPAPVSVADDGSSSDTAASVATMVAQLVTRAGTWGIGVAGAGPRLIRDEPWTDWAGTHPDPAGELPINVGMWPGTDPCDRVPMLLDRPWLVAVTTPNDRPIQGQLSAWWTDGSQVDRIDDEVENVTPVGQAGIAVLARTDGQPWPDGRYEVHVISGAPSLSVTFCLSGGSGR